MGFEARDSRLNANLPTACHDDIGRLCFTEKQRTESSIDKADGTVLTCMLDKLQSIRAAECKSEIIRIGGIKSEIFDADIAVDAGCESDVKQYCDNLGNDDIQTCLRKHMTKLSRACREAEFGELHEEKQALELKPALLRACDNGLKYCADSSHCAITTGWKTVDDAECGLKCLRDLIRHSNNNDDDDVPESDDDDDDDSNGSGSTTAVKAKKPQVNDRCRQEVGNIDMEESTDYRLMPGIEKHCMPEVDKLCSAEKVAKGTGGDGPVGTVIECLTKNRNKV